MTGQVRQIHLSLSVGAGTKAIAQALVAACPDNAAQIEAARKIAGGRTLPLGAALELWRGVALGDAIRTAGDAMMQRPLLRGGADLPVDLDALAVAAVIRAACPDAIWSVAALPLGDAARADPRVFAMLEGYAWIGVRGACLDPATAVLVAGMTEGNGPPPSGSPMRCGSDPLDTVQVQVLDATTQDRIGWIAFDIDDMTGEEIGHACDHLRDTPGVVELVLFAGQGKKGRPVTRFEILVKPGAQDRVIDAVFLQTTTLGVRHGVQARRVLPRWPSEGVGLRAKQALRPDGSVTEKIEADDLAVLPTLRERRAARRR